MDRQNNDEGGWELLAVFHLSRLDTYFLTIIAGIENTERVAYDFSNERWRNTKPDQTENKRQMSWATLQLQMAQQQTWSKEELREWAINEKKEQNIVKKY